MRAVIAMLALSFAEIHLYAQTRTADRAVLDDIARVASVMVDGDVCQRIVTDRALRFLAHEDPRDKWAAGDNYEVDHQAFLQVKKTLRRLSMLASFPCDVNLWMPLRAQPGKIHIVVRNVNEMSQFWPWGALAQNIDPRMKAVLETGRRLTVMDKPGWISVLAPVADSEGDIVGVVEVVGNTHPDQNENVK